ncbi:MAG: hypothetical protein ABGZ24_10110 [Fuerstiella sp.]
MSALDVEFASDGVTSLLAILIISGTKERHSIVFSDRRWWNHTVVLSESLMDPISKLYLTYKNWRSSTMTRTLTSLLGLFLLTFVMTGCQQDSNGEHQAADPAPAGDASDLDLSDPSNMPAMDSPQAGKKE